MLCPLAELPPTPAHRPCPVCQGQAALALYHNRMAAVAGFDMSYVVARCLDCGAHYAQQLPASATYRAYYDAASKYDLASRLSALEQMRLDAAFRLCQQQAIDSQGLVIDLGCGNAAFLAALRQAGWQRLLGLDPGPHAAVQAQRLHGLDGVRVGTLEQAGELLPLPQADLVCLLAVLEHLPELNSQLAALLQHLKPGCRLLIEVPALECFDANAGEPYGEFSLEHIQYFSSASLRQLLQRLGARVLHTELLPLPADCGSLFVLAQWDGYPTAADQGAPGDAWAAADAARFDAYLQGSARRWQAALARIPHEPFVLYGAGSHSARLLSALSAAQSERVLAVLDANPNLQGKTLGPWTVQPPTALADHPGAPVLISSYRSEHAIAAALAARYPNRLQLMYGNASP